MRIFKTKHFAKWAKKHIITDKLLQTAAKEIVQNSFEANLGGYVLKKRMATKDRGKSGSARTIVVFKKEGHCFFVYGFEKNEKENISVSEKKAFKLLAKELLGFSDFLLNGHVRNNQLLEIDYD